jgi:hypothetical protein
MRGLGASGAPHLFRKEKNRTVKLEETQQTRAWRGRRLARILLGIAIPLFAVLALRPQETAATDIPVIKGELGPCSADFTVTDAQNNPLYDAKIHVIVRYGFMSKRKSELEIGTNGDGKARIEGLPSKVKKPLEIKVSHGEMSQMLAHDPGLDCQASFNVALQPPQ